MALIKEAKHVENLLGIIVLRQFLFSINEIENLVFYLKENPQYIHFNYCSEGITQKRHLSDMKDNA